ncbi:uncharacterized protein NESG_02376 [Nematocida ausubeli]|uniref:Uncharacterized protein n=1 Tax=Nematocida ausubeli (strain ATCC PRA-371 / ERTm2) TaxID=1913371 RepID=A0A086IZ38_NEMA1|nr:uncharacterized protein NESG_02376 [Nematocida ausubeli]KFG25156.1 hypothetical protein NESG_02376 [Nematocida ausubeli]
MQKNVMTLERIACSSNNNTLTSIKSSQNPYILTNEKNTAIVQDIFNSFGKCSVAECPLNSSMPHAISLYSNILFCIAQGHANRPSLSYSGSFSSICNFEKSILFAIQIDRNFKPTCTGRIDVRCEQEIESITYMIYIDRSFQTKISTADYYHILDMLLCRKEYERFFIIYAQLEERSLGIYKLALLASLYIKNEKTTKILAHLIRDLGLSGKIDADISSPEIVDKRFRNLVEEAAEDSAIPDLPAEDKEILFYTIKNWHSNKHKEFYWTISLQKWSSSKGAEGASEAMIDKCILLKKYEEGWFVYKESTLYPILPLRMFRISRKALSLVIHAINNCNTNMWVERYLEIATIITRMSIDNAQKVRNTFSSLLRLKNYSHISCIARLIIKQYPDNMLNDNQTLCSIFEDIFEIFRINKQGIINSGEDPCLPELALNAYSLYSIWRKKNSRGVLLSLFWGRSKEAIAVYNAILQIAIIIENKPQIVTLCKNIWEDSLAISEDLSNTLMHVHNIYSTCNCLEEETNVHSRGYLMHVLDLLSSAQ